MTENEELIIYGRQPLFELLTSDHPVSNVYIAKESDPRDSRRVGELCQKRSIPLETMPKAQLQRICGPVLHQGFAARIESYHYFAEDSISGLLADLTDPLILVLDQVQDPHNLGAIIRTAEIAGADLLILPLKGSAAVNATVAKTSAGALFHTRISRCNSLFSTLQTLKTAGVVLAALHPANGENIYQSPLTGPLALITGSEGEGVRKNILNLCDRRLNIPQAGKTNSLNASVSTAIVLYESVRQRRFS